MQLYIASLYRQLSADIKLKMIRLKTVLLDPRGRKPWLTKLLLVL